MRNLVGGGGMGDRIRAFNWSDTPLGSLESWPQPLWTIVGLMLASAQPMFLAWGGDRTWLYNEAFVPILGRKHSNALGRPSQEVWAEAWSDLEPLFQQVFAGHPVHMEDFGLELDRNGKMEEAHFAFSYSPTRDEAGLVVGLFGACIETTQQVVANRRIAEADERMNLALSAGDGVGTWDWDIKNDRVVADERFAKLYGVDVESARAGAPIAEFFRHIHPADLPGVQKIIAEELETGRGFYSEYRLVQPDGSARWVAAQGSCHMDVEGRPLRFPGASFDITAKKAIETELRVLNETLEARVEERTNALRGSEEALRQAQKMEAVGQLTGGLAHDFNNLLAGISGSLELTQIRMQQGRLTDVDKYMTAALGAAKRAAALTHRLLAFSRRQTLDPKPTDVNRLVTGMQEMIQRTVGPGIPVEVVGISTAWPALVDSSQLENALLNLCINARDAMPDGGKITIETANKWFDERGALQLDLPEGQYLSLSVTDTGAGMPPDVIARAFEPFFTTKPTGEGTGLGLSMIYGFAKQSGGQVRIYSEVGQGTTVCIYLPRHYGDIETEASEAAKELPRSDHGETVLVVDDEPTVRMLISDILEDLGYTAIEASDSAAGLKILQSDVRIDLLITDVGLPGGMNGRQMADAARVGRRCDLKVLFITGYAENAILGAGKLAHGMAVMTKPFPIETMAARIRSLIEAKHEEDRARSKNN